MAGHGADAAAYALRAVDTGGLGKSSTGTPTEGVMHQQPSASGAWVGPVSGTRALMAVAAAAAATNRHAYLHPQQVGCVPRPATATLHGCSLSRVRHGPGGFRMAVDAACAGGRDGRTDSPARPAASAPACAQSAQAALLSRRCTPAPATRAETEWPTAYGRVPHPPAADVAAAAYAAVSRETLSRGNYAASYLHVGALADTATRPQPPTHQPPPRDGTAAWRVQLQRRLSATGAHADVEAAVAQDGALGTARVLSARRARTQPDGRTSSHEPTGASGAGALAPGARVPAPPASVRQGRGAWPAAACSGAAGAPGSKAVEPSADGAAATDLLPSGATAGAAVGRAGAGAGAGAGSGAGADAIDADHPPSLVSRAVLGTAQLAAGWAGAPAAVACGLTVGGSGSMPAAVAAGRAAAISSAARNRAARSASARAERLSQSSGGGCDAEGGAHAPLALVCAPLHVVPPPHGGLATCTGVGGFAPPTACTGVLGVRAAAVPVGRRQTWSPDAQFGVTGVVANGAMPAPPRAPGGCARAPRASANGVMLSATARCAPDAARSRAPAARARASSARMGARAPGAPSGAPAPPARALALRPEVPRAAERAAATAASATARLGVARPVLRPLPRPALAAAGAPRHSGSLRLGPRADMSSAPLIIVHLHGAVADLFPQSLWAQPSLVSFFVRPGAALGLRALAQTYQLAAVCHTGADYAPLAIAHLHARGASFDAVYDVSELACAAARVAYASDAPEGGEEGHAHQPSSLPRAAEAAAAHAHTQSDLGRLGAGAPSAALLEAMSSAHFDAAPLPFSAAQQAEVSSYNPRRCSLGHLDYGAICEDFGISRAEASARVLVIGSIDLDHTEIELREGERLVGCTAVDGSGSAMGVSRAAFTAALPLPELPPLTHSHPQSHPQSHSESQSPVTLLVPSARAQPSLHAIRMEMVLDVLHDLAAAGRGHFADGFHALSRRDVKKATICTHLGAPCALNGAKAAGGRGALDSSDAGVHAMSGPAQHTAVSRILVVRGAKARSSMLVPFDAVRLVRADELTELVRDLRCNGAAAVRAGAAVPRAAFG
ncbi:hypothetical protein KFE25_009433 [Diacronema lutheri]|uniref:Uncharacterized protein n=1 Tax=Diacronema lutheri TaxID=2081491 RepID=A0A8J5XY99_DIALT|nr:hypothetical protein KFE25_009433 [Diacronema lutheri]